MLGRGKHARELDQKYRDMAAAISEQGEADTPFFLKKLTWHENCSFPANMFLEDLKSMLFPFQNLLRKLDPGEDMDCELGLIKDYLHQKWVSMVINNERPDDMNVMEALDLYKSFKFHWVLRAPDWGDVSLNRTYETICANGLCSKTLLLVCILNPDVRVLDYWVEATLAPLQ
jgi:hypothetical protein